MTPGRDLDSVGSRAVLVVGGAGGIGRAIVRRLLHENRRVVVVDASRENCERLRADLDAPEDRLMIAIGDASQESFIEGIFDRFASSDLDLVHSAGTSARHRALRAVQTEEWEQVLRNSLTSVFTTVRAAARKMIPRRIGRIVLVSSVVAIRAAESIEDVAYGASRAGILGLVRSQARTLARSGITINAVAPGLVSTAMTRGLFDDRLQAVTDESWNRMCPMGRLCTPEDVAGVVRFLLSADAAFLTGVVIPVDGGYVC